MGRRLRVRGHAPLLERDARLAHAVHPLGFSVVGRGLRADALKRFGLRPEQRIKGLSHGQRVKATLLLVLARRPQCSCSTSRPRGSIPVARHEILRELTDLMQDDRRSVLFSSHNTWTSSRSPIRSPHRSRPHIDSRTRRRS